MGSRGRARKRSLCFTARQACGAARWRLWRGRLDGRTWASILAAGSTGKRTTVRSKRVVTFPVKIKENLGWLQNNSFLMPCLTSHSQQGTGALGRLFDHDIRCTVSVHQVSAAAENTAILFSFRWKHGQQPASITPLAPLLKQWEANVLWQAARKIPAWGAVLRRAARPGVPPDCSRLGLRGRRTES